MHLRDACREVMEDQSLTSRYPNGISSIEIFEEIRKRRPASFPLCSVLDVADEMRELYGRP